MKDAGMYCMYKGNGTCRAGYSQRMEWVSEWSRKYAPDLIS